MVTPTRRDFVRISGAGSAGAFTFVSPRAVRGSQANSAVTIGLVGCGNRGTHDAGLFAKNEFARIAALCDIYEDKIAAASRRFSGARTYRSIQELLASDVDAVLIATPVFLHPEHFELAVNARKHIFMEKPAGADVQGCLRVLNAARRADKTKRISVDFQQRYGKDYRRAHEIVQSGQLGPIKMIRTAWLGGGGSATGPRPGFPPEQEKIRNWYRFRETSGDIIVEQNCHNFDVVTWFTASHPVKASGYGARAMKRPYGDVMDSLAVSYQFADGIVYSHSAMQIAAGFTEVGETFVCAQGTVWTSRRGIKVWRPGARQPEEIVTKGDITMDAVNDFVDGVRNNRLENAAITAVESTLVAILGREAIYAGKELSWRELTKGQI